MDLWEKKVWKDNSSRREDDSTKASTMTFERKRRNLETIITGYRKIKQAGFGILKKNSEKQKRFSCIFIIILYKK